MSNLFEKIGSVIATIGVAIGSFFGVTPEPETPYVPETVYVPQEEETLGADAVLPIAGMTFYLSGTGISSNASSFTLTSFTVTQNGKKIMDSELSETFYVTFEPGSRARQEIAACTTVAQNGDGTATISGCTRGMAPITPYTASTSLQFAHAGGSIVIFSNPPQLYNQVAIKDNDETITGYWDFPTPVGGSNATTKDYVLSVVTGGSISTTNTIVTGVAGETVATGTIVYLDKTLSRWYKADNDLSSTYVDQVLGIAQGSGTSGNSIPSGVLTYGLDSTQKGMTGGNFIFLSATAGATSTATTSQVLGKAVSATTMFFDTNLIDSSVYVPTTFTANVTLGGTTTLSGMIYGGFYATATASTTFSGASSPQASFITSSGTASTTSTTATSTTGFSGFAVTNASTGGVVKIQTGGIVSNFSGLTKGVVYYTSTAGSISSSFSLASVPVGTAISGTELLIEKGKRIFHYTSPTLTDSGNAGATVLTTNINAGFIPRQIRAYSSFSTQTGNTSQVWTNGTLTGVPGMYYVSGISTPTDSGFTLTLAQADTTPASGNVYLIIEE